MTYKICYWDNVTKSQKERDSTPEEDTQRAIDIAAANAVIVPESVSMRQARKALLFFGYLDDIAPAINALPSPQKEEALIDWDWSDRVHRGYPLTSMMASALGLSEGALDALFVKAAEYD